jgi:hypothetical protein
MNFASSEERPASSRTSAILSLGSIAWNFFSMDAMRCFSDKVPPLAVPQPYRLFGARVKITRWGDAPGERPGYVQNWLSPQFVPAGSPPRKPEHAIEFNSLLDPLPMLLLQSVIQYYTNVGGGIHSALVFGFRTEIEF